MYLVRVTPPINFTFSDMIPYFFKTILAGDINSLNLLVSFVYQSGLAVFYKIVFNCRKREVYNAEYSKILA